MSKKNKNITLKVTEEKPLMEFLIQQLPQVSRNTIKSYLYNKQVFVGDRQITQFNFPLRKEEDVRIVLEIQPEKMEFEELSIVFEDEYLLVIDKNAGLLSVATDKQNEKTAYNILSDYVKIQSRHNKIFIVHRLDRDTSGLLMFAKSEEIQEIIQRNWQENKVERIYIAVVEGKFENPNGTITSWLKENSAKVVYSSETDNGGQKAVTHFKLVKAKTEYSLVELSLETGRKNQIRVHLQSLGHPVVGDRKYGATHSPIKRLGLHAMSLAIFHPVSGRLITFESKMPSAFKRLLY
jgi:23S rRNA pseudouridine1911/1915/1917 synthase